MLKRSLCFLLAAIISAGTVFTVSAETDKVSTYEFAKLYERAPYMSEVLEDNGKASGKDTVNIELSNGYSPDDGNSGLGTLFEDGVFGRDTSTLVWRENRRYLAWDFELSSGGLYKINMGYFLVGESGNNASRNLYIDGETPFFEADNIIFYRKWKDEGEIRINSIGDEVRPSVKEFEDWQNVDLQDSSGYYPTPLIFCLDAGKHTLMLEYVSQDMAISDIMVLPYEETVTYKELSSEYKDVSNDKNTLTFQAEDTVGIKNDATIRLESNADPKTVPKAFGKKVFNTVGGTRWKKGNQAVSFDFEVEKSDYYSIALRVLQSFNDGQASYRKIMIDGAVPCKELLEYRFNYSSKWQTITLNSQGEPMKFWLESGKHTLTMEVTMGEITRLLQELYTNMTLMSEIIQEISLLTGSEPDPNYDYQFFKYIPDLEGHLKTLAGNLDGMRKLAVEINGQTTSISSNFKSISKQVRQMISNPFTIAKKYNDFTDDLTTVSQWYIDIQEQPLLIDEFTLASGNATVKPRLSNIFEKLLSTGKNFIVSFQKDYNNIASILSDDVEIKQTVNVWISRGTEWSEIVKEMADEEFTPETGIQVNMNVVPASQLNAGSANVLLLSIVSGNAPEVALGLSSTSPVEFAIRDAVVDLSKFSDFDKISKRFLDNVFIPLTYNSGVYALPETMGFEVLFYRTDIISKYGITVPKTNVQLYYETLPQLYEHSLEYFQTQIFEQYLFQHHGSQYTADGLYSNLDTPEAFQAFKEYTEMFTNYGSPITANFFNRFRTGEMPIGIGGYDMYVKLCTSAPELNGKWTVTGIPGTVGENGEVDCSCSGLSGECDIILSNKGKALTDASWEFLKWWTSDSVQQQYAREIEALIGVEARWNSANLSVFRSLEWNRGDIGVFEEYWKWATCNPAVLGGSYTARHINNAFTSVVVSGEATVRDALEEAVKNINRELKNKQIEYGVRSGD